jgi:hypothetical protein
MEPGGISIMALTAKVRQSLIMRGAVIELAEPILRETA